MTLALMLAAPASASAGRPDTVDPAMMQPALNPTFAPWDCWRTGAGIVCDGRRSVSWTNEPIGLECDGRPVYSTGSDVRTLRRVGDADGLALSARTHVMINETDDHIVMTFDEGDNLGETFGGRWSLFRDTLTFERVEMEVLPTPFIVKAWTRVP